LKTTIQSIAAYAIIDMALVLLLICPTII